MIVSLLYLTTSRPNLAFSVDQCARFQSDPKKSDLTTVKIILRYLKGPDDLCMFCPRSDMFEFKGYIY